MMTPHRSLTSNATLNRMHFHFNYLFPIKSTGNNIMKVRRTISYREKCVCLCFVRASEPARARVFNSTLQEEHLIGGGLYEPEEKSVISSRPPPVPLK